MKSEEVQIKCITDLIAIIANNRKVWAYAMSTYAVQ